MIVLHIDTSVREEIKVGLEINGKLYEKKAKNLSSKGGSASGGKSSQETLPLVEKLLKEKKIKASEVNEIKINKGPGSFTGLRVGISIANALGFSLNIPINGKKVGEYEEPIYTK